MAKSKRYSGMQKFLIVSAVLVVFQIIFIVLFSKNNSQTIRQAITKAVEEQSELTPERREQLRIQLAMADFMLANDNKAPNTLEELVPKYFDVVPTNPRTGKAFEYNVVAGRPVIGDPAAMIAAAEAAGVNKNGEKIRGPNEEEDNALIASLSEPIENVAYVYDPTGKRDPFLPFDLTRNNGDQPKTPLEGYTLGQLKVTAILEGIDPPTAMVEDESGKGFPVTKGTKIGVDSGEVVEILKDRVLILETKVDFTGKLQTRTVEMKLKRPEKK